MAETTIENTDQPQSGINTIDDWLRYWHERLSRESSPAEREQDAIHTQICMDWLEEGDGVMDDLMAEAEQALRARGNYEPIDVWFRAWHERYARHPLSRVRRSAIDGLAIDPHDAESPPNSGVQSANRPVPQS